MRAPENAELRRLALTVLRLRGGPAASAEGVAGAAERAYGDLARVLAQVIGEIGVKALTDRALHLANHDYPGLVPPREPKHTAGEFSRISASLGRQDPAVATETAAAVLATFLGLLARFVGESLAARLVRQAWPDAASSANTEEK